SMPWSGSKSNQHPHKELERFSPMTAVPGIRDGEMPVLHSGRIATSIKVVYTLFVLLLVPVYWVQHGPANFLWFSDIALLLALAALWLENRFLASMMAVGVLIPEI